jgi:hypothetical protein
MKYTIDNFIKFIETVSNEDLLDFAKESDFANRSGQFPADSRSQHWLEILGANPFTQLEIMQIIAFETVRRITSDVTFISYIKNNAQIG